jgi:putative transposase
VPGTELCHYSADSSTEGDSAFAVTYSQPAMGRVARTSLADGYFHVYARGIAGGSPIFVDDADRRYFVRLLTGCVNRHRWVCHAYTLLSTHYHLVLEATRTNLSAGLHQLNGRYAAHVNRRHGRFGHVFAERFQARVIESEGYLYDACAYVVQNPVQASLCDQPEDWPWSYCRYPL